MARDLDLGLGHTAYHRASLVDLYLHAKFHQIEEMFCGLTNGRTYVRTNDGDLRPALLGRLCRRVDLIKKQNYYLTVTVLLCRTGDHN